MWVFLYLKLCSVLCVLSAITIDDKLDSPFSTDCFKRISIGERLVVYDVSRTGERKRVKDCEKDCNDYKCTFFSFGISASGNGTCELSTRREISRRRDADYDIYQRTKHCKQGRPTGYEETCYRRLQIGQRLEDRYIRHSLPCDTLQACQHQCSVEQHFQCHGFNIRLDESGLGRGICELTSVSTLFLNPERDFYRDNDFDYYEKDLRNTSPNCGYTTEVVNIIPKISDNPGTSLDNLRPTGRPWTQRPDDRGPWTSNDYNPSLHPNEIPTFNGYNEKDRFHNTKPYDSPHGRSMPNDRPQGRVPGYVIIDAGQTQPPISGNNRPIQGRYPDHPPNIGPSYPVQHPNINPGQYPNPNPGQYPNPNPGQYPNPNPGQYPINHPGQYPNSNPGQYPNSHPGQYPNLNPGPSDNFHGWSKDYHREVCFQREFPAMKLRPEMVIASYTFRRVSECENMCNNARFECMGFTYRYSRLQDTASNCHLTDARHHDFHSDIIPDYDCDIYIRIKSCKPVHTIPDTDCFSRLVSESALSQNVLALRVAASSVSECELECLRSDSFICRSFSYRMEHSGDNCELSDWPAKALTPNHFVRHYDSAIYERGSFGRGCEFDMGPPNFGQPQVPPWNNQPQNPPNNWGRDAWKHFTVRGWPCRKGSQCTLNREVGFWSCEVEGGDQSQWDYCCRPQHACGYSQGYSYPWCYVGETGPDQWRPCSEHYYPNYENRPSKPSYESHHGSWSSEYGPGSEWPISYLYPEPPPNETIYFHPNENYHEPTPPYVDQPSAIQFRPTLPTPYPKAIVQKLDLKDVPKPEIPDNDEEKILNINPRNMYGKKIKETPPNYVFETSGNSPKNNSFPNFIQGSTFAEFMSSLPYINDTVEPSRINKTKAILDQIEKIIEQGKNDCNKTSEKMKIDSSEGIAYATGFLNQSKLFAKDGESAMTRFWNWGQEYYSKNPKSK